MLGQIPEYLGFVQTWIWIWGIVVTSTVGVAIWAVSTRLPGAVVFVLTVSTAVLMLVGLDTMFILCEKVKALRGGHYQRAVGALEKLRTQGETLRNRPVKSEVEVKFFIADVEAFEAAVLATMQGAVTETDIAWFRNPSVWTVPSGVMAYNDEHALMKAILEEKLRRMHEIACQLEMKISA